MKYAGDREVRLGSGADIGAMSSRVRVAVKSRQTSGSPLTSSLTLAWALEL
jgi:hypothetical protein